MRNRISARELFDQLHERLGLRWLRRPARRRARRSSAANNRPAGRRWRAISTSSTRTRCRSSAPRNWPGSTRSTRASAGKRSRRSCDSGPLALVISQDQTCPTDLRACRRGIGHAAVGLAASAAIELLNLLQYHLARALAPRITLHGVFMEIYSIGVLITGESGAGKSELALELITPRPSPGRRRRARIHPDRARRARRHLPGDAAGPAGSARPRRHEHPPDVRRHRGQAEQVPAPDRAPDASASRTAAPTAMARLTGESSAPRRVLDLDVPVIPRCRSRRAATWPCSPKRPCACTCCGRRASIRPPPSWPAFEPAAPRAEPS